MVPNPSFHLIPRDEAAQPVYLDFKELSHRI
jgi:hypothetical protein